MSKYPRWMVDAVTKLRAGENDTPSLPQGAKEVLGLPEELCSHVLHETAEEVVGGLPGPRGGRQLAFLAVEYLPSYILENLGKEWAGYVIAADEKFFYTDDVINVPAYALWNPQYWWCLYHETGHLIIDGSSGWVDCGVPSVQKFLSNRTNPSSWLDTVRELAADVVGFELGFFGDCDTFLRLSWERVPRIERFQSRPVAIEALAIRTFFVKMFQGHFRKCSTVDKVNKKDLHSLDFLQKNLLEHMDCIEGMVNSDSFPNKAFLAAENARLFKELYPFACHLSKKISELKLCPDKKALSQKNTEEAIRSLRAGRIWWRTIASPEAVLYHLIQNQNPGVETRIATVLTFWHQQMLRFRKSLQW